MANSQLGAQSDEALTNASPSKQLAALAVESLTGAATTPSRQLAAISVESLTNSSGPVSRQLAAISVEVLVPARLGFIGWGTPIKSFSWS